MEIKELPELILDYLNTNRKWHENSKNYVFKKHDKEDIERALLKLLKDGYIDDKPKSDKSFDFMISYDGIYFQQSGGYLAQIQRLKLAKNRQRDIEERMQNLSRQMSRATWVMAIATLFLALPWLYKGF